MLDTNATKALAAKLAALTTARRRLRDALTAASAACGALGLDTSEDGNPCDAASVGRNLAAAHRDATQAAADLSAVLDVPATPAIGESLAWIVAQQTHTPPGIVALVSTMVERSSIPSQSAMSYGERLRLALEILRSADALRFRVVDRKAGPIAAAIEATAAVVRAEIEGTG